MEHPGLKMPWKTYHPNTEFLLDYYHAAGYVGKISSLIFFTRHKQGKKTGRKY